AAERVGRHQAVAAAVPARRERVGRVGEDRQADRLALDRPGIVAPRRRKAPAVLFADLALRVLDLAVALDLLLVHGLFLGDGVADADAERALLGVAEGDRANAGVQVRLDDEQPRTSQVVKVDGARFVEQPRALGGAPLVARRHPAVVAVHLR